MLWSMQLRSPCIYHVLACYLDAMTSKSSTVNMDMHGKPSQPVPPTLTR